MKHIVFFSGGVGSYFAAKRIIEKYNKDNVILLFTDTNMEDSDLYRFIDEASNKLGSKLVKIADGRDPWDVAFDKRFLPNSRVAPCSHVLKQKMARKYILENYSPDECILYLGIDWTEQHRTPAPIKHWHPYKVEFPLCEEPYLSKEEMLEILEKEERIGIPRLYKLGFAHNNCGGFCFKAGIGHFKNLLEKDCELYIYHENKEQEMREYLNRYDISILRRTKNGRRYNITLRKLREEIELQGLQLNMDELFDIDGCGCFVDNDTVEYDD